MHTFPVFRSVLCVLVTTLFIGNSQAQQVGSYPTIEVTIDKGAFYCKTPELVRLVLDLSRQHYENGHPMIPVSGCGRTMIDLRAVMTCIQTYNNGLTETDILLTEIKQKSTPGVTSSTRRIYVLGEERLIRAVL